MNYSTKVSLVFRWGFFRHFQRISVDGSAKNYFALQKSLVRPNFICRDFLLYAWFLFMFTFSDHFNQIRCNPNVPATEGICLASCWTYQQGVNMSDTGFNVSAGDQFPPSLWTQVLRADVLHRHQLPVGAPVGSPRGTQGQRRGESSPGLTPSRQRR